MATPPDFSVGQTLTSAQMNAVGLWKVTTCTATFAGGTAGSVSNGVITVGSGNTSVTVSNAFSAEYDNYRLVISGIDCSASNQHLKIQIGGQTTNYFWGGAYSSVLGAGAAFFNGVTTGDSYIPISYTATQNDQTAVVDILQPYATAVTKFSVPPAMGDSFVLWVGGAQTNAVSYSSFTILPNSGTMTGGKIRLYGYRN